MRTGRTQPDSLEWRVLARDPLMIAVPSVWRIGKTRIRLEEMRDRPWIMPHPKLAPSVYEWQVQMCREAGFEPKIVGFAEDPHTSRIMIACGMAAAFSNERALRNSDAGVDFVSVEGLSELFTSEVVVAWATGGDSRQVGDFVRCLADAASDAGESSPAVAAA